jgi:hypothetical protein
VRCTPARSVTSLWLIKNRYEFRLFAAHDRPMPHPVVMDSIKLMIATLMLVLTAACVAPSTPAAVSSPSISSPTAAAGDSGPVVLPDGKYTVGVDILAGTYVASPMGSCYWARYDATGAAIANNFTTATRVQVVIEPSDYSFVSERCGGWYRDTRAEDAAAAYPDSPEASVTRCSPYKDLPYEDQIDLAERYLTTLRGRDGKKSPQFELSMSFTYRIKALCTAAGEQEGSDDYTIGSIALTIYQNDNEFRR